MILRGLRGENFMKFEKISLQGIPERGLIGIEGSNEGGKSTIGELIQFALFGKTICTADGSVLDLIAWDQDHASVELEFEVRAPEGETIPGAGRYRVWREIDRYGTNFARLLRVDPAEEIASGLMKVQEALEGLLHFTFEDFTRSFFLAESDPPRSPDEMAHFLDRIVGTNILEEVKVEVTREKAKLEEHFGQISADVQRNKLQIDKYVPNIAKIPEVEETKKRHETRITELKAEEKTANEQVDGIVSRTKTFETIREEIRKAASGAAADAPFSKITGRLPKADDPGYKGAYKELTVVRDRVRALAALETSFSELTDARQAELQAFDALLGGDGDGSIAVRQNEARSQREAATGARGRARWTALFMFLLALLSGGALLAQEQGMIDFLTRVHEDPMMLRASFGGGAGLALLLSIVFGMRAAGKSRARGEADAELGRLGEEKEKARGVREQLHNVPWSQVSFAAAGTSLDKMRRPKLEKAVTAYQERATEIQGDAESVSAAIERASDDVHRLVQRLRALGKELKKERQKTTDSWKRESSKRDRADSEIREYQKQDGRRAALEEQNQQLREQGDEIREEIDTRMLLIQLLDETRDSIRHRAGPSLGRCMRRLLPSVTGGRYTDLQVTPDFRLRLFTSEKSDFLQPHELSGGTYEGLSLGFRLAFSQAFIRAVTRSPQFLFLDEPFKAMDPHRIHSTLKTLTQLSEELCQVFVVSPRMSSDDYELFDRRIEVRVGLTELELDLGGGGARASVEPKTEQWVQPKAEATAESDPRPNAELDPEPDPGPDPGPNERATESPPEEAAEGSGDRSAPRTTGTVSAAPDRGSNGAGSRRPDSENRSENGGATRAPESSPEADRPARYFGASSPSQEEGE